MALEVEHKFFADVGSGFAGSRKSARSMEERAPFIRVWRGLLGPGVGLGPYDENGSRIGWR